MQPTNATNAAAQLRGIRRQQARNQRINRKAGQLRHRPFAGLAAALRES